MWEGCRDFGLLDHAQPSCSASSYALLMARASQLVGNAQLTPAKKWQVARMDYGAKLILSAHAQTHTCLRPSMQPASLVHGLLHAWLPKEVPCFPAEGAETTRGMQTRRTWYQNSISKARLCLVVASYGMWCRHTVNLGRRAFLKSSRRMTKDQLLKRLQDHAVAKGGFCRTDSYINSTTKVPWECEHGHTWHARPNDVLHRKSWCPQCAVDRRSSTLKRLQDHARKRGGQLLSTKYTNTSAKYIWQCKLGHTWEARANDVLNSDTWCPECARKQKVPTRRSLQDLHKHAASRGGRCLATEYCGMARNVQWECKKGHSWLATPKAVLSGNRWCPFCAQRVPIGLERLRELAAQRGGECVATEYVNAHSKVPWKCERGHVWEATVASVLNLGRWCPHCRKIGLPRLQAHAASLGGRCLAKSYRNRSVKLLWECREGHRWKATADNVMNKKSWCPTCATKIWRTEEEIRNILQTIFFPSKFGSCYPQFLEGLQLDGYCPQLSLAFEYQGEQHYDPDNYFHFGDISSFEAQQERDIRKRELCKAAGVRLVLIPYFANDKRTFVVTALLQWFSIEEIAPIVLSMHSTCREAGRGSLTKQASVKAVRLRERRVRGIPPPAFCTSQCIE